MSLLDTPIQAKHPSDVIGNWGPVQRTILLVIVLSYHVAPFSNAVIPLYAPKVNFTCHHHDQTGRLVSLDNACEFPGPNGIIKQCSNFTYDHSIYERTIIEEFDLVCGRAWYASLAQSFHQVGYAISGLALGYLSDRKGRLFAARTSMLLEMAAGFSQVLAPNIYIFWICRFFIGIAAYGRFLTGYVLTTEWIGPKLRAQGVVFIEFGWNSGYALLLLYYYNVPNFKVVSLTAYSAEAAIFLLYCLLVLESPRWLITNSKNESADRILTKAAKAKGKLSEAEIKRRIVGLQEHMMHELQQEKEVEKQTIVDVWKDPVLLKLSLILYFTWFTHAFIGYASMFNTENLGGSFFMNLSIFLAADFVNYFILLAIFNRLPRKKTMVWGLVAEVISLIGLLVACLWDDTIIYRVVLSIMMRSAGGLVVTVYYLYTAETFPTAMRQASMGTCSVFARMGSVIAPFVKELTNYSHLSVSFAIFLVLTAINLILILYLPDTGKIQVADTIGQKKKQVEEKGGIRSMSIVSALSFSNPL